MDPPQGSAQLWDISVPPMLSAREDHERRSQDLSNTFRMVGRRYPDQHFATVQLENVTGLTFIYDNRAGGVRAVHGHTADRPVAHFYGPPETHLTRDLIFIYVPLAGGDRITAIGGVELVSIPTAEDEVPSCPHQILVCLYYSSATAYRPPCTLPFRFCS